MKMNERLSIIADLERCVGCHSCSIACNKEHELPEGESWIRVREIGPEILDGKTTSDHIVEISSNCNFCEERLEEKRKPACVTHCPTEALKLADEYETLKYLKENRKQIPRSDITDS